MLFTGLLCQLIRTHHSLCALWEYVEAEICSPQREQTARFGMFDLRHLEHHPLLRLCWNKQDPNMTTMVLDSWRLVPLPLWIHDVKLQPEYSVSCFCMLNEILNLKIKAVFLFSRWTSS